MIVLVKIFLKFEAQCLLVGTTRPLPRCVCGGGGGSK